MLGSLKSSRNLLLLTIRVIVPLAAILLLRVACLVTSLGPVEGAVQVA